MRQQFESRAVIGVLIWIGILAVGIIFARRSFSRAPQATTLLAQYIGNQRRVIELELPNFQLLRVGDPVYAASSENVAPIGVVARVDSADNTEERLAWVDKAFITLYGSAPPLAEGDYVMYHSAPDSSAWVLQTMLPPEKREELSKLIVDSYRENQRNIVAAIRPIVEQSLRDASSVIREDLEKAFEAREDEIRLLGQRFQSDIIEKEIVPLIEREIWPIVREESQPLANQVGQEIWSQVSVFRFGWRYLYDRTPLPEQKLAEKEFDRFVDEKVVPILKSHVGEFVDLQKVLIEKISQNEKVKTTVADGFKTVVKDGEVQDLLSEVFREVFLNNDRLQGVLEERWNGPEAKNALALATERLEPTITDIGISLFGSPHEKITPEFARVLRHRILHKDSRWLTLHQSEPHRGQRNTSVPPTKLPVRIAETQAVIPYAPARNN